MHRLVFTDGEALDRGKADERATWKAKMGLFKSHVVTFTVRDHYQNGLYYEANTMCTLDFPVVGIESAPYYISAVRCDRGDNGDTTTITAHLPDLLGA
jgi:prophage tail gpP-like protein